MKRILRTSLKCQIFNLVSFKTIIQKLYLLIAAHPAKLSLSQSPLFDNKRRKDSPDYEEKPKIKMEFNERYKIEHTYTSMMGGRTIDKK